MRYTKTLDYCQACYDRVRKVDLVRQLRAGTLPKGQNYFTQSSYDNDVWKTVLLTSDGNVSMGPYHLSFAEGNEPDSSNTYSRTPGSATFTFSQGTFYETVEFDLSDWTSWVFSFEAGPKHDVSTNNEVTYAIRTKSTLGDLSVVYTTHKTYSAVNSQRRMWWYGTQADLAAVNALRIQFAVLCTSDAWSADGTSTSTAWIDRLQLEKDVTKPGNFIETNGTAIDRSGYTSVYQVVEVCPRCRESLPTRLRKYEKHTQGVPVMIPNDIEVP